MLQLSLEQYKEHVTNHHSRRIPQQRLCQGCGTSFALLNVPDGHGGYVTVWAEVAKPLRSKKTGRVTVDDGYICPICSDETDPHTGAIFADDGASACQSKVCRQCRENRSAGSFEIKISLIQGSGVCISGGTVDTLNALGTTTQSCCSSECSVFAMLCEASAAGVQKQGAPLDPCENCTRYWNKNHPDGACIGTRR